MAQNVLQRRARLADLEAAFRKGTRARVRHIEASAAFAAWTALGERVAARGEGAVLPHRQALRVPDPGRVERGCQRS